MGDGVVDKYKEPKSRKATGMDLISEEFAVDDSVGRKSTSRRYDEKVNVL